MCNVNYSHYTFKGIDVDDTIVKNKVDLSTKNQIKFYYIFTIQALYLLI